MVLDRVALECSYCNSMQGLAFADQVAMDQNTRFHAPQLTNSVQYNY